MTMLRSAQEAERKRIAVLGCTGSIGRQTLDVCRQHADKLEVVALSAHGNTAELVAAAREFNVKRVAVTSSQHAHDSILEDLPQDAKVYTGPRSAVDICLFDDVDEVLVAIVGVAGLSASAAVLACGKQLALANKESLVVGGDLLMPMARPGLLSIPSMQRFFNAIKGKIQRTRIVSGLPALAVLFSERAARNFPALR